MPEGKKLWALIKRSFGFLNSTNSYPLIFTLGLIVVLFQQPLASVEAIFYDFWARHDRGIGPSDQVVVVYANEESDLVIGDHFPYASAHHLKMINNLLQDSPQIVNWAWAQSSLGPPSVLRQLNRALEDYVQRGGLFRFGAKMDSSGDGLLSLPKPLDQFGPSLFQLEGDSAVFSQDGIHRRAILNFLGEDSLHLWTANQYRRLQGKKELSPRSIKGAYSPTDVDITYSLFRYPINPLKDAQHIQSIPFHRVWQGDFPKGFFQGKIVLIGPSYVSGGRADFVKTPFNRSARPKARAQALNVHAAIILSLIEGKTVQDIPIAASYLVTLLVSLFLSLVILKLRPFYGLVLPLISIIMALATSYFLFTCFGLWAPLAHILLTILAVYYIWIPFKAIDEYRRRYAIEEQATISHKLEALKRNFLSLMSHDLKTPVAKIAGIADVMLAKRRADQELSQALGSIIESTKDLNQFISSILDLTKIESQNLKLNLISKDINTVIDELVKELQYQARAKDIRLNLELSPLYPIKFDLVLMRRVLSNLIENAIKYSGPGARVTVETWEELEWVYIQVSDTGPGIAPEEQKHIFDKFYRVKNDAHHSISGTGLGLYLVKYFVELHGGEISVESELNKRTSFLIKLKNV